MELSQEQSAQPGVETSQEGQVQPNQEQSVLAYREIQSKYDQATSELTEERELRGDYEKGYRRASEQVNKLQGTLKNVQNELAVERIVSHNPHLKDLAVMTDFSDMTTEDINEWGKAATNSIQAAVQRQSGAQPPSAQATEAPSVQSASAPTGASEGITPEAFAKLSSAEQKKILEAQGILK